MMYTNIYKVEFNVALHQSVATPNLHRALAKLYQFLLS
jgi:hypothetical protein